MLGMEDESTHRLADDLTNDSIIWSTNYAHNVEELVLVIPTAEQGDTSDHLCENAAA